MNSGDETILIIGAGASGLKAAKVLSKKFRVHVLEAANRLGGRIFTTSEDGFTRPVETGAEFIHGDLPLTFKLVRKAGLTYEKHEGAFCRVRRGNWENLDESFEGWEELLDKMKRERRDMPLLKFLDKHYSGTQFSGLRQNAQAFAEGFNLADIHIAGIKGLYREWSVQQQVSYRITEGYSRLIEHLEKECRKNNVVFTHNCMITHVEWKHGFVKLRSAEGKVFTGSKVIITVPASVLQRMIGSNVIHFSPSPDEYLEAYRQIGYGPVIKLVLEFNEPFWNAYNERIGYIISEEPIPTWWPRTQGNAHFLVGWKGGPQVLSYRDYDEDSFLQVALDSLSSIFQLPVERIKDKWINGKVYNWQKNEFADGGYSYSLPESDRAKKLLNTPINDTIYFAGEALYNGGAGGTVEAALNNGRKVARRIKKGQG